MPGVGIRVDVSEAQKKLAGIMRRVSDTRPLMNRIGAHEVGVIKLRFEKGGPGWPSIHPYFAELKRRTVGSKPPLTFRGKLAASIMHQVRGKDSVRAGSPRREAATHQYGADAPRAFYLYLEPEYVTGKRGKPVPLRDDKGRILGKLRLRQAPNTKRQLVFLQPRAREFIKEPDTANWDEKLAIIARHLLEDTA